MELKTSYFGNMRNLSKEGFESISISAGTPEWFEGLKLKMFAPTFNMLKMSEKDYVPKYKEILSKVNIKQWKMDADVLFEGKKIAFLCYEKPEDFCHRHLFAEWMRGIGFNIDEWKKQEEKVTIKTKRVTQEDLQLRLF